MAMKKGITLKLKLSPQLLKHFRIMDKFNRDLTLLESQKARQLAEIIDNDLDRFINDNKPHGQSKSSGSQN